MEAVKNFKWLSLFLSLTCTLYYGYGQPLNQLNVTCARIECPSYDLIDSGIGFEIRRYNFPMWMSAPPVDDVSFVDATSTGFSRLFDYILGENAYEETIEMTAPVITQVKPSDAHFFESSFVVSFYVPEKNQPDPPPAKGLHVQKWSNTYVAVRRFGGFVSDTYIGRQAAILSESIADTKWAAAVEKGRAGDDTTLYTVAQYNSPFEFSFRTNEIWFTFGLEEEHAI